jgi:hypothetical protein
MLPNSCISSVLQARIVGLADQVTRQKYYGCDKKARITSCSLTNTRQALQEVDQHNKA